MGHRGYLVYIAYFWQFGGQCHPEVIQRICDFWHPCIGKVACRRSKQAKIWVFRISIQCTHDNFQNPSLFLYIIWRICKFW